jgi:hypothetical protein
MTEKARRLTGREHAAVNEAARRSDDIFGPKIEAVLADIRTLLDGRRFKALSGAETIQFMALQMQLDGVALEQKHFAYGIAEELLDPG